MAEERIQPKHENDPSEILNRDDMRALNYVLQHVRGSSPSSMSFLTVDEYDDEV